MDEIKKILDNYIESPVVNKLVRNVSGSDNVKLRLLNGAGSSLAIYVSAVFTRTKKTQIVVLTDREEAAYFYNDLQQFIDNKKVNYLPSSYRRRISNDERDNDSILVRTETLNSIKDNKATIIVTYPEALAEKVVQKETMDEFSVRVKLGDSISMTTIEKNLINVGFERVEFVYEPGQFSIRGSILDVYSYSEELPIRIDFFGDDIETIRYFDVETQLSGDKTDDISIVPDLSNSEVEYKYTDFFEWLPENTLWWIENGQYLYSKIKTIRDDDFAQDILTDPEKLMSFIDINDVAEWGLDLYYRGMKIDLHCKLQPTVNKHFDILADTLIAMKSNEYVINICSNNELQLTRINDIFIDKGYDIKFNKLKGVVHYGFYDEALKICLYTEHEIFDRYHKYRLQTTKIRKGRESISINELNNLHPGDYVVHMDHGIGRFGGLVKINNNGSEQETIRLIYKNNSELFVGIHSLHKISKYKGKDSSAPAINKLGSNAWNKLKQKTKAKVKDIARELIQLYAKRKEEKAFAFSEDSYLQEEMETSFTYDETDDQMNAIRDVKSDMEKPRVMDRLVCGDVGFGKTEVAMRAAFKAVADNKQVVVLVPTTILAYQHYNSFKKRLENMPCRVEYISRMRKNADIKKVLKELEAGLVDILIGTHRVTGKDVKFKDLGLLIIDEEQKFGVSVKEKLKKIKLNVDTLTMTATPIPRTLQFSLMGARDMSIIKTPPPNRYPIVTELHRFNEDVIKEVILYELARNGQVLFIHNRVDTIMDIKGMLQRILPQVKCCVVHGKMRGTELEKKMNDFIRGDYDILIATTIIESGLDIPNANTIIINQAQNYGLGDLHQLRGRVGRSNRKAFCYLLSPPLELLNPESRRRLKAIEDFSGLGSGFNIAMQDLDIRGSGNILGAEQSGFISEIGYETYQRILNEALLEIRNENPKLKDDSIESKDDHFVLDCTVETDFEALIPATYVANVSERVRLYRILDNMETDDELKGFINELSDRFGEVPRQVNDLMEIVKIRHKCIKVGIERVFAKNHNMTLYLVSDQNSVYYQSVVFTKVLEFIKKQVFRCSLEDRNGKLVLIFKDVTSIRKMASCIEGLYSICGTKS